MESSFSSALAPAEIEPTEPAPPPSPHNEPDNQLPVAAKKPRHRHTVAQLQKLNELYELNSNPPLQDRIELAQQLNLPTKVLNAWFQNKRASAKKRNNKGAEAPLAPARHISTLAASSTPSSSTDSPSHPSFDELAEEESLSPEYQALLQASSPNSPEHQLLLSELLSDPTKSSMNQKKRLRPNNSQAQHLKEFFNGNPHPSKEDRQELGEALGMTYQSITNWFQNQRSLIKRRKEDEVITTPSARSRTFSAFPPASGHPSLPPLNEPSEIAPPSVETRRSSRPPSSLKVTSSRPRRSRPEPYQLDALKYLYVRTSNPTIEERTALAIECSLDIGKVTNWFRNLRQTTRKRAKRNSELGEDDQDDASFDSGYPPSTSVSRDGSPLHSPSASMMDDVLMDDLGDDMDVDKKYRHRRFVDPSSRDHSDDEEYRWEAVTPSPSPPPHLKASKHSLNLMIDPILYAEMEKETAKYSTGVRVEDALLLLGFHRHAFVHRPSC